jgi:peptidoglycan/LPS O-acetylase OafA/YrhL
MIRPLQSDANNTRLLDDARRFRPEYAHKCRTHKSNRFPEISMTPQPPQAACHDFTKTAHRQAFIDSLRGWAILGVLMVHCCIALPPQNWLLWWFMQQGSKGVQLFFIISALTLSTSWTTAHVNEHHVKPAFFIRRFFRIAPMFYLAIILYIFLNGLSATYWAPNGIQWWSILMTTLFIHGLHPESINAVVPGGWSIAVEVIFYTWFPFLIQHIQSLGKATFFLLISFIICVANQEIIPVLFSCTTKQHYIIKNFTELNFLNQLPIFAMGMICHISIKRKSNNSHTIMLFGAFSLLVYFFAKTPATLWAGCAFSICTIFLASTPVWMCVNRFMTTLGKLSYSIYLIHFAVLTILGQSGVRQQFGHGNAASIGYFALVTLASAALATVSYNIIEKPGIALGQRIIDKFFGAQGSSSTQSIANSN